jgi:sporulation protein YlmC with PRC-barrel domain
MRRSSLVVIALVAALAVPEAWAQQAPSRRPAEREAPRATRDSPGDILLSSAVIGARVKNHEGKDLGEIDQLVIERRTGRVSHAVVGLGGLAGVGEAKVVVAWKNVRLAADPDRPQRTVASVDQSVLERAPRWMADDDRGAPDPSASPPIIPPVPGVPVPRY